MKGLKLFVQDWKHILKSRKTILAIAILLCMPLLYAGMFIASYWNPYGNLDKLPVAVVNSDKGAVMDGESLHVGQDLADELKKNSNLDFHFVDKQDGEKGLKNGDYYMEVLIPENFSTNVTTLTEKNPQPAKLVYKTNQGNNFVASQISATAVAKLKDKVGDEITKSYTKNVFSNLKTISNGLAKAGDGAEKLHTGMSDLEGGFTTYQEKMKDLSAGTHQLSQGIGPLAAGAEALQQNMENLHGGAQTLVGGISKLNTSQKQLTDGAEKVAGGLKQLGAQMEIAKQDTGTAGDDTENLVNQMKEFVKNHPELKDDPALKEMMSTGEQVSQDVQKVNQEQTGLAEGMSQLQTNQSQIASGMQLFGQKLGEASAGAGKIAGGAAQLNAGMAKWSSGFETFGAGVKKVDDGSHKLSAGTSKLADGMIQLEDGSGELADKLSTAAKKSSDIQSNDAMVNMFSRPVQLVESQMNKVPNYGVAMVPYFLTLGLFVGGLLAANVIPFSRESQKGHSGWTHFVNKLTLYLSLSVLQTVLVDAVILYGFNIDVLSIPHFVLLSLITSFIFVTLIFMFVSLIGPLGKFAAIFLLVSQLASSGGTFPIQLAPHAIQTFGKYLPMTYAVKGFRSVISTGDWTKYWGDVGILLGFITGFMIIALLMVLKANRKSSRTHLMERAA
ncbi:YhgE/Pip domain-containing protein [Falsibacillus albus]|uniref:YhgE/Pip domain-containing protein n=1 Tax=Falsibacillus albus TaxID=2478915 RepID=A0A3L7JUR7_9BACI|nr:YhgE/Pip domain-containing protein [Falsibacillus albus]RLQ93849.1 YhgE/Pip domain-containing protein [Falsibacillus albus]